MKALCWHGKGDIRCDVVPDPKIEHGRDAIIKMTACAICGSDLHLMDGYIPFMEKGDVLGHEFMGEVVEVGADNKKLKVGDRVVVPFTICCGECEQCRKGNWSVCERSNRTADNATKAFGYPTAGLFGYSHLTGAYRRPGRVCPRSLCRRVADCGSERNERRAGAFSRRHLSDWLDGG